MPRKNKRLIQLDQNDPDYEVAQLFNDYTIQKELVQAVKPRPEFHIRSG